MNETIIAQNEYLDIIVLYIEPSRLQVGAESGWMNSYGQQELVPF